MFLRIDGDLSPQLSLSSSSSFVYVTDCVILMNVKLGGKQLILGSCAHYPCMFVSFSFLKYVLSTVVSKWGQNSDLKMFF